MLTWLAGSSAVSFTAPRSCQARQIFGSHMFGLLYCKKSIAATGQAREGRNGVMVARDMLQHVNARTPAMSLVYWHACEVLLQQETQMRDSLGHSKMSTPKLLRNHSYSRLPALLRRDCNMPLHADWLCYNSSVGGSLIGKVNTPENWP